MTRQGPQGSGVAPCRVGTLREIVGIDRTDRRWHKIRVRAGSRRERQEQFQRLRRLETVLLPVPKWCDRERWRGTSIRDVRLRAMMRPPDSLSQVIQPLSLRVINEGF